jgi:hypothetical protein
VLAASEYDQRLHTVTILIPTSLDASWSESFSIAIIVFPLPYLSVFSQSPSWIQKSAKILNRTQMNSTESIPPNRTHSKVREDGGNIAYFAQDGACIMMSSDDYRTIGATSEMHLPIELLRVRCECTLSSK